jgi:hypothetical protein
MNSILRGNIMRIQYYIPSASPPKFGHIIDPDKRERPSKSDSPQPARASTLDTSTDREILQRHLGDLKKLVAQLEADLNR